MVVRADLAVVARVVGTIAFGELLAPLATAARTGDVPLDDAQASPPPTLRERWLGIAGKTRGSITRGGQTVDLPAPLAPLAPSESAEPSESSESSEVSVRQ